MQSNPLQSQQQEWLIGLNNRLIDMNERLIEQRGQDQRERELLLQIVQNNESHRPVTVQETVCLLYTSPSPRDKRQSRMPSSA